MKKWIAFVVIFFAAISVKAQYIDGPDRYFYDEDFDWRWDVRVRISDGIRSGYLTHREANRLYRRLEKIERREWAFQSDGYYSPWEQDEIWMDVVDLNRAIGMELTDWDRRYYGYTGMVITGPLRWYFGPSYDFYRFDHRGYGSIRVGYVPRNYYPVKHVYYTKRNNYTTHWSHRHERVVAPSRNNPGARGYSERRTGASRHAAPEREVRSSRTYEREALPERRTESSRTYERVPSSGRVMEPSRPAPSERSAERMSPARPEGSRADSRMESRPEPRTESRTERSSGTVNTERAARAGAAERSSGPKSSVERASGSSRSAGPSSSSRSSGSSRSSSSENGRTRN